MTGYRFGDIVLVPFPFTDQSTTKQRPAVVVSSEDYQSRRADLILMAVTSQSKPTLGFGEMAVTDWKKAHRQRTERICLGNRLRSYGKGYEASGLSESNLESILKHKPSPPHRTTVFSRLMGAGAVHAGFAALDPACAPWCCRLWAMDEGGLRRRLQTKEVLQDRTKTQMKKEQTASPRPCGQGTRSPVGEPSSFPKRLLDWRTLDIRPRQLRDEGMSGVNQHAYISLIHRRFKLLVP
jgi:hypothetical protein